MKEINKRVEIFFRLFARYVYRYPLPLLILVAATTAVMTSQLPKLTMDASTKAFFHEDSEVLLNYNAFIDQFGREDRIMISIEPERVFDEKFLIKLKAFHGELEASLPYLDEVTSLLNARNTRGEGDELIVEDLFEHWPSNTDELAVIEKRAMSNLQYRDLLLSEDGKVTAVIVRSSAYASEGEEPDILQGFDDLPIGDIGSGEKQFLDEVQASEFVAATLEAAKKYHSDDFPLAISGSPVIAQFVKASIRRDAVRFIFGSLVVSVILLSVMYRRSSAVFMPLATIIFTVLSTLGLMAATGTAFKVQTQILPSFLMAVGVGSAVHVLSTFYKRFDETGNKEQSIVDALGHTGTPVLGAGITTAVGLMSFSNASLAPLAELGIFAGVGVLVSLIYTLVMIPALLSLLPVRQRSVEIVTNGLMTKILTLLAEFSFNHSRPIIVAFTIGTLVAIWGAFQLNFYHNPLSWFPEKTAVRQDTIKINSQLHGVQTLEIVLDTREENGLYQPALLHTLDKLGDEVKEIRYNDVVSHKTLSIVDIVKEINLALNEDRPEFYSIPQNRNLVAQELFLFENSGTDDLEDFVDSQFSKARYTVKIPWSDASSIDGYRDQVMALFRDKLPSNVELQFTGLASLYSHIAIETMHSIRISYLIAVVVISILMILFIGDLKIGLIAMIPNLSPIVMTLGIMGILDIPMAVFTMFIGSIALGLAVDDTLHFLHGFNRFHQQTGSTKQAIVLTFQTTGRAMTATTVSLSLGFFIFIFSTMEVMFLFGLLTGLTIVLALVGDFILTPAILNEVIKDRQLADESAAGDIAA